MVDRLRAFHRAVLFVAALACRCAAASRTCSERGAAFFDRPGAVIAAVLLPATLATFSCATALTGTRESISVASTPAAADARLSCAGVQVDGGITPATLTLRRNAGDCTLTVAKAGFVDETRLLEQGVNPAYWANFVTLPVALAASFVGAWGGGWAAVVGGVWSPAAHRSG